jgi:hypothetical protein
MQIDHKRDEKSHLKTKIGKMTSKTPFHFLSNYMTKKNYNNKLPRLFALV